jgi:hypothetical protein
MVAMRAGAGYSDLYGRNTGRSASTVNEESKKKKNTMNSARSAVRRTPLYASSRSRSFRK